MAAVCAIALVGTPHLAHAGPAEDSAEPETPPAPAPAPDDPGDADDPQLKRAMESYARGKSYYNSAQYDLALSAFQEAASLYASPDFQYNIGLCYERLEKYDEALRAFTTYLNTKPDAEDRGAVEDRIRRIQEARKNNEKMQPDPTPPKDPDEGKSKRKLGPAGYQKMFIAGAVLTGVGAALGLGGGVGFGIVARRRGNEIDDIQTGGNPDDRTFADAQDLEDEGKRAEVIQIAFIASGAAIGLTGIILMAVSAKKRKPGAAGTAGTKTTGHARTRLVPYMGPTAAGIAWTGRF